MFNPMRTALTLGTLGLLLACGSGGGGGSTPSPTPTELRYTDPTNGTFRLVRNGALSRNNHLVLEVVYAGTTPLNARGIGFYLRADTAKVQWTKVLPADPELVQKGVVDPGTVHPLFKAKDTAGTLQVGIYQKGTTQAAVRLDANAVLARVALDPSPGAGGGAVSLAAMANRALFLPESGDPQPITVEVGSLEYR